MNFKTQNCGLWRHMEYKNKNRLQAHPPNSQLWLALGERNMRREKGERVFLYTVPLFLHQTHTHWKKNMKKGECRRPVGFWILQNNFREQTIHIYISLCSHSAPSHLTHTHSAMPYSYLLLEATFIESKGLHSNNMVCQKGRHLFRVRKNTFSIKAPCPA